MNSFQSIKYCTYRDQYRLGYTVSSKGQVQLWNVEDIKTFEDVTRDVDKWDWWLFERYCHEIYYYSIE